MIHDPRCACAECLQKRIPDRRVPVDDRLALYRALAALEADVLSARGYLDRKLYRQSSVMLDEVVKRYATVIELRERIGL